MKLTERPTGLNVETPLNRHTGGLKCSAVRDVRADCHQLTELFPTLQARAASRLELFCPCHAGAAG
jgi:hypothetical protein